MTDNPTPNDIALLREALARRLYWADVKHDDKEGRIPDDWRDHWWRTNVDMPLSGPGFLAHWLALADAAFAPGQHDGAAIPAGMKAWAGGDNAPADWDGGLAQVRDGRLFIPQGPACWRRGEPSMPPSGDIVAYTPKPAPTEQARAEGYVLVPREPTEAMLEAGAEGLFGWADDDPKVDVRLIWEGMLDAAMLAAAGDDAVGGGA